MFDGEELLIALIVPGIEAAAQHGVADRDADLHFRREPVGRVAADRKPSRGKAFAICASVRGSANHRGTETQRREKKERSYDVLMQ